MNFKRPALEQRGQLTDIVMGSKLLPCDLDLNLHRRRLEACTRNTSTAALRMRMFSAILLDVDTGVACDLDDKVGHCHLNVELQRQLG